MNVLKDSAYNLDTCSLLVEVNLSVWVARKLDREATDEVVSNKNAGSHDAARVNKSLFAGRSELKEIEAYAGMVRNWVKAQTMPWNNNGTQLLPTIKFVDFDNKMCEFETEFWRMVDEFLAVYNSLITAQAFALGSMFKRDDYPSVDTLKDKFNFSVVYSPVPAAGDFRVDIGLEAQKELCERLEAVTAKRVKDMEDQMLSKIAEQAQRMSKILGGIVSVKRGDKEFTKTAPVYPSLLEDAWSLVELVEGLNMRNPDIKDAAKMLRAAINGRSLDSLKNDALTKAEVKKEVDTMINKYRFSI